MTQKNRTIRFKLACLVAACVIPVWLVAGLLVLHAYSSKCEQINTGMRESARTITMAVDRELTGVQRALVALATSPHFKSGDYAALHAQCRELLTHYAGADIIVADATGQQVVNSFKPYGTTLPKRNNHATVARIFRDGKPIISDLFYGAVTKRPMIGIDVPVFVDGRVAYDLAMTFPSDRVADVLAHQKLAVEWRGFILDSQRILVARSGGAQASVGKPVDAHLDAAIAASREGTTVITGKDGFRAFFAFSPSTVSSWVMAIEVPEATVMADTYRWLLWAVMTAASISFIGVLLAFRIAHRIAGDIQSLVEPALAIGRGEAVTAPGKQSVQETAEVAEALVQASALLQQHARDRDRAEMELSRTIEDLKRETAQRLQAMEELHEKDRLLIQQSRQAAMGEMIGNIAHQWRQPLNALALSIQQVPLYHEMGDLNTEFLEENLNFSMRLIEHMSRTIDDFRNYFKPDKEKVRFSVGEAVRKTLALLDGSLKSQGVVTAVELRDDPVVEGYPNEFAQVLLNILTNAKDALADRGVAQPRIRISIGRNGERSVVTVTDNAGGVPEGIIGKIFEPYFTTKGPQKGTGLGLFMSKSIIEKNMAGRLVVENVEGGARFTIEV